MNPQPGMIAMLGDMANQAANSISYSFAPIQRYLPATSIQPQSIRKLLLLTGPSSCRENLLILPAKRQV